MRKKSDKQMQLTPCEIDHPKAAELEAVSRILDQNDSILDLVSQDLSRGCKRTKGGANGMTVEQVLRAALVKQILDCSYRELAFHIADSATIRRFMGLGVDGRTFGHAALQDNVARIRPAAWEAINRILVDWAGLEKIEKGREVRIDCTVVESNIHYPTDSSLLKDCVWTLTRLLKQGQAKWDAISYRNHKRRAKRRQMKILNTKKKQEREEAYRDLLYITGKTVGYAERALDVLEYVEGEEAAEYSLDLIRILMLTRRVMHQTEARVFQGVKIDASDKVVSIFEPHTDVIVKDRRDTYYGHKVCLCVGKSQLISDCVIYDGNPADTSITV